MSLKKLNKISGLPPEKQTTEEQEGPSKSLKETIEVIKNIKIELRDVEHYIEKSEASKNGVKQQLQEQIMKTKQEMVKLERMLSEEVKVEGDVFEDNEAAWGLR